MTITSRPMTSRTMLSNAIKQAGGFSPTSLFSASTIGAIYAYDDFSYLYQKSDGSTPVTALEQPVGLVVDQRWGGARGDELVTNGDNEAQLFSTTPAVSLAKGTLARSTDLSATSAKFTGDGTTGAHYIIPFGTGGMSAGKSYLITLSLYVPTAWTGAGIKLIDTSDGSWSTASTTTRDSWVTVSVIRTAKATAWTLGIGQNASETHSGQSFYIDNISVRELPGMHAYQTTDAARPTLNGTPRYANFDRVDDHWVAATGGGSTTGFMLAGSIQPASAGTARTIFSDRGTNTGYKVEIDASNNLLFTAGNGVGFTTCTGPTLTAGTNYAFCVWHDGTNLNIKVGTAAVVQQAFATATAGTSTVTLFKDNAAASGYFSGRLYALTYIRNASITEGIASQLIGWAASKGGFAP